MSKNVPTYLKIYLAIIVVVAIGGYIVYNSRILIEGPKISIESPQNGSGTADKIAKIEGKTANTSSISINNRPITIDENGHFSETLLLTPGYNIIVFRAEDKFEREITERLELFYKQDPGEEPIFPLPTAGLEGATTTAATTTVDIIGATTTKAVIDIEQEETDQF